MGEASLPAHLLEGNLALLGSGGRRVIHMGEAFEELKYILVKELRVRIRPIRQELTVPFNI